MSQVPLAVLKEGSSFQTRIARAAVVDVRLATSPAERQAVRDVLWEACRQEGWTEAAAFLDHYVVPPRTKIWYVPAGGRAAAALVLAEEDLPILADGAWPQLSVDSGRWAEIALLGVTRSERTRGLDLALIRAMARYARSAGVTHYVAILDDRRYAYFRSMGILFREVPDARGGGRKPFWGETCFPAILGRTKGEAELRGKNPAYWEFMFGP